MLARNWRKEPSYTIGGNVSEYSHMEISMELSQKLKIELPKHLAMSLQGIHPKESGSACNTTTPMFIASLFTITQVMELA
jgi:hypothetical protein